MEPIFVGQIALMPYGFVPNQWLECDGTQYLIRDYPRLYALIGTTFGGDGRLYFGVPDLKGRAVVGAGTLKDGGTYVFTNRGGAENVGVISDTVPMHSHALYASSSDGTTNLPTGALLANVVGRTPTGATLGNIYNPARPNGQLTGTMVVPVGGQQPHNNMQPSLGMRYCIACDGNAPSKS
jgi:microcystin-dependent protein